MDLNFCGKNTRGGRTLFIAAFTVFLVILGAAYSNSFYAPWHFDDFDNIGTNANVHVKSLSWPELKNTLFMRGVLSRPVAYLSFGLNYYFGGLEVFGYHIVNFAIHYLAAVFLFLFIYDTMRLPLLRDRYGDGAFAIAFTAALFWAINPVQVTSVTYIVQRMSSMAGLFYILSMYLYLKGRTAARTSGRVVFFALCFLSFLLAFGTKENALVLPVAICLYDLFLIQGLTRENILKNLKIVALPVVAVLILGAMYRDFTALLEGYSTRPFSLAERLLTEPRVILFYVTLLLYPIPSRLMLLYDIDLSRSLFEPWTTAAALAALALIIACALVKARQWPLVSFCVLFFFLNHVIEGSILPLEIIYEHRNYIPSMLFFVPPAILLLRAIGKFAGNRPLQMLLAAAVFLVAADQGHTTYQRNEILSDEKTLWLDNVEKAPDSSRVHALLGKTYLNEGQTELALAEFQKAVECRNWVNLAEPAIYHCYLGNFFLDVRDDPERAVTYYTKSLEYSITHEYYNGMAMVMLKKGNLEKAKALMSEAIALKPGLPDYRNNDALVLLKLGDYEGAIAAGRIALELKPDYSEPRAIIAEALHLKGRTAEAISFWEDYLKREPDRYYAYLALLDLYDAAGNRESFETVRRGLLEKLSTDNVRRVVEMIDQRKNMFAHVPNRQRVEALLAKGAPHGGGAERE